MYAAGEYNSVRLRAFVLQRVQDERIPHSRTGAAQPGRLPQKIRSFRRPRPQKGESSKQ